MKNRPLVIGGIILVFFLSVIGYWLYQDHLHASGRLYPSQSKMCEMFAKSYLRTMRAREITDDTYDEAWTMAIDIETEIHKLCQLELTREAIDNYKPSALDKYSVSIADELQDCLPKSDMASKEKCDRLLESITDFEDCANAGFPVMESYPERCSTPDGRSFVKQY